MKNLKLIIISIIVFGILISTTFMFLKSQKEEIISGKFESKKGVMDKISLICFNSGYLEMENENISICLDESFDVNCINVKLFGKYQNIQINEEKYKIFNVNKYKCLE